MNARVFIAGLLLWANAITGVAQEQQERYLGTLKMDVPRITSDDSVKYEFPIVYVRSPRRSADGRSRWTEVGHPRRSGLGTQAGFSAACFDG